MSQPTIDEITEALDAACKMITDAHGGYCLTTYEVLAERIREHGIAPPDGFRLVPIITEATPFSCGINGDPPQVDNAWTPPCKVWCGRKQCAAKESP